MKTACHKENRATSKSHQLISNLQNTIMEHMNLGKNTKSERNFRGTLEKDNSYSRGSIRVFVLMRKAGIRSSLNLFLSIYYKE